MCDDIRRPWAVAWLRGLRMASLLTAVILNAAIEQSIAEIAAIKHANPAFSHRLSFFARMLLLTPLLVSPLSAYDVFRHSSTVASCRHAHLACTAKTFVAWALTYMLQARKRLSTNFATAPAIIVVCLRATFRYFVLTAKAHLRRPHVRTRRAWPSMAGQLARVWTLPSPLLAASLST